MQEERCIDSFPPTAFVTLTDRGYFSKARTTIRDLRTYGRWEGIIVLIVVDFMPTWDEIQDLGSNLVIYPVKHIDHTALWETWKKHPIRKQADDRHYKKVYQWDKLHVFTTFFKSWSRIIFLDAGSRVFRPVFPLLFLRYEGKIMCPDDSDPYDNGNRLACQFDFDANPDATVRFHKEFGVECLQSRYFLNCFFILDTSIIQEYTFDMMTKWMTEFPISCCNEMGIMNLYFNVKHNAWSPIPQKTNEGSYYFGWNEYNYKEHPSADKFIVMKYPSRPLPVL